MRIAAKILALTLLLALRPACGGGGGGGTPGSNVSFPSLPGLVSPVPAAGSAGGLVPAGTPGATTINVSGMKDSDVETALQTALNAGGNIVMTTGGGLRTVLLSGILTMPSSSGTPNTVILDGSGEITLSGSLLTGILQIGDLAQLTVQRMSFIDARATASGGAINSLARVRLVTIINCVFDNCQTTQVGPDQDRQRSGDADLGLHLQPMRGEQRGRGEQPGDATDDPQFDVHPERGVWSRGRRGRWALRPGRDRRRRVRRQRQQFGVAVPPAHDHGLRVQRERGERSCRSALRIHDGGDRF